MAAPSERKRFGQLLRELRGSLRQHEVAAALTGEGHAVTDRAVSGWERGQFAPDRATTQALDNLLGGRGQLLDALGYSAAEHDLSIALAEIRSRLDAIEAKLESGEGRRPDYDAATLAAQLAAENDAIGDAALAEAAEVAARHRRTRSAEDPAGEEEPRPA